MQTYTVQPSELSSEKEPVLVERRMASLDGWRGVAILAVFFRHYTVTTQSSQPLVEKISWLCSGGWVGVDLFFVLSGFLITGILLDTREHKHYFRNFYARRTLRIFPLYYGIFAVMLLLTPLLHLQWMPAHLLYPLYLGNIATVANEASQWIRPWFSLGIMWSLAVEEQFYLVWPFVVSWVPRRETLLKLVLAGMGFALAARVTLHLLLNTSAAIEWNYHVLPMRCDGLLTGALAAILLRQGTLERANKLLRWPAWISAVIAICIYAYDRSMDFHYPAVSLFLYPCLAWIFAKLLLVALQKDTWAYRIGSSKVLQFFGKYSYGIYVYHRLVGQQMVLQFLQTKLHSKPLGSIAFFIEAFVLSVTAAVLSYELYERHFLKLKRLFSYSAEKKVEAVA